MPPKKGRGSGVPLGGGAPDAAGKVPQWRFRNDLKAGDAEPLAWTSYTPAQSEVIEAAYIKGLRTANIGDYYVDTKRNTQTHVRDSLKTRRVRRCLVDRVEQPHVHSEPPFANRDAPASPTHPPASPKTPRRLGSGRGGDTAGAIDLAGAKPSKMARIETIVVDADSTPPLSGTGHGAAAPVHQPPTVAAHLVPSSATQTLPVPCTGPSPTLQLKRIPSTDIRFPARPEAKMQPVVFLPQFVDSSVVRVVQHVLERVPVINRRPLDDASVLIAPTRRWLKALGRPDREQGVFISLPQPLSTMPDSKRVALSDATVMTAQQAKALAETAMVTYVGQRPAALLLPNASQSAHASLSYKDHLKTQHLMISGGIRILYNGRYEPISKPPAVIACSTPGINFAYSDIDRHYFTKPVDEEELGSSSGTVLDKEKVLKRMRLIWQHVLLVLDDKYHVQFPVLCAIGCGAFKGVYGAQIPRLWGQALAEVVCNSAKVLKHIQAIFLSLPTFGKDNNFAPFQHAINEVLRHNNDIAYAPLILIEDASMIDIAVHVASMPPMAQQGDAAAAGGSASSPPIVGILNPSDVQALRHGWVGMYWDGGHIALEEVLAMQTTLLLHHVGLNKALFSDPKRLVAIKKVLPDMDEG